MVWLDWFGIADIDWFGSFGLAVFGWIDWQMQYSL
jgi:hypothetical protein